MTEKQKWFWTIFFALIAVATIAGFAQAVINEEDKDGAAYGSAVARDTAFVTWWGNDWIDLAGLRSLSINIKSLVQAADTVMFRLMGSNYYPDDERYFYSIDVDTLYAASMGDSTIHFTLPYGTGKATAVIPRYIRLRLILGDASAATATLSSGLKAE